MRRIRICVQTTTKPRVNVRLSGPNAPAARRTRGAHPGHRRREAARGSLRRRPCRHYSGIGQRQALTLLNAAPSRHRAARAAAPSARTRRTRRTRTGPAGRGLPRERLQAEGGGAECDGAPDRDALHDPLHDPLRGGLRPLMSSLRCRPASSRRPSGYPTSAGKYLKRPREADGGAAAGERGADAPRPSPSALRAPPNPPPAVRRRGPQRRRGCREPAGKRGGHTGNRRGMPVRTAPAESFFSARAAAIWTLY